MSSPVSSFIHAGVNFRSSSAAQSHQSDDEVTRLGSRSSDARALASDHEHSRESTERSYYGQKKLGHRQSYEEVLEQYPTSGRHSADRYEEDDKGKVKKWGEGSRAEII